MQAAPARERILAAARFDSIQMLRNGEQLFLTTVLPLLALIALSLTEIVSLPSEYRGQPVERISVLVPGILALAIVSASFTGQAIATAFDRRHGVLRLMAMTPLGAPGFLAGRILAVLLVQALQLGTLVPVALILGWRAPLPGVLIGLTMLALGSAVFVALGFWLAGLFKAEVVLAAANIFWVLFATVGSLVMPIGGPDWAQFISTWSPSGAFGEATRSAFIDQHIPVGSALILVGWLGLGVLAVRWSFRWED